MLFLTENSFKGFLCFMRSTGTKTEISSTVWELLQWSDSSSRHSTGPTHGFVRNCSKPWLWQLGRICVLGVRPTPESDSGLQIQWGSINEFNSMLKALHQETLEMWSNEQSMDQMKSSYLLQFIFWTVLIINLILACNLLIWFALDY